MNGVHGRGFRSADEQRRVLVGLPDGATGHAGGDDQGARPPFDLLLRRLAGDGAERPGDELIVARRLLLHVVERLLEPALGERVALDGDRVATLLEPSLDADEVGLRILLGFICREAAKYDKALILLMCLIILRLNLLENTIVSLFL